MRPGCPRTNTWRCRMAAGSGVLLLVVATAWADTPPAPDQVDIGIFTAVEGKVAVTHPGLQSAIPAKVQEGVLFKDVIETEKESRTKALLNDDSILTVGEHSRVEITEHIYDPNKGVRSVVLNLVKGKVRALVGKAFTGSGSKFEIHTPTAVAAARGTYFIVFHINGVSGISNVGTHGHVDFSSGGRTVPVPPGQFSITPPGGGPPSPPAVNTGSGVPSQVASAVKGTEVKDNPKEESPKQMAMASGGTAPVLAPSTLTPPGVSGPGGTTTTPTSSPATTPTTTTTTTTTTIVVQVPAVTSGATTPPPPPPPPPAEPPPPPPPPGPTPPPPPPPPGPTPPPPPPPGPRSINSQAQFVAWLNEIIDWWKVIGREGNLQEEHLARRAALQAAYLKYVFEKNGGKDPGWWDDDEVKKTQTASVTTSATTTTVASTSPSSTTSSSTTTSPTEEPITTTSSTTTTSTPGTTSGSTTTTSTVEEPKTTVSSTTTVTTTTTPTSEEPATISATTSTSITTSENEGWFKKILTRLFNQFSEFIAKVDQQEGKAFAKAESNYEKRLRSADAEEQKKIESALEKEADQIKKAQQEYEKAIKKGDTDAQANLDAELKRAADIREAEVNRAKQIEEAKIAKAALIQEARIVRAQMLEAAKVDRSGDKLVQRVSRTGDQYLAKLREAGASQAQLDEARRQINEKIAEAETKVKLAQQAAVQDNIVAKLAMVNEQRAFIRYRNQLGGQQAGIEQRKLTREQRHLIREQRQAVRQAIREERKAGKQNK